MIRFCAVPHENSSMFNTHTHTVSSLRVHGGFGTTTMFEGWRSDSLQQNIVVAVGKPITRIQRTWPKGWNQSGTSRACMHVRVTILHDRDLGVGSNCTLSFRITNDRDLVLHHTKRKPIQPLDVDTSIGWRTACLNTAITSVVMNCATGCQYDSNSKCFGMFTQTGSSQQC